MRIQNYEKINITIPRKTIKKLEELIPRGERSGFIAEATERLLIEVAQKEAILEAAGVWSHRGKFASQKRINQYLRTLRGSTRARQRKLRQ